MSSPALCLLTLLAAAPTPADATPPLVRLADLSDTIPGKLIGLVNDIIPGTLRPKKVTFEAPSTVVLEDLLLLDPAGDPVARIGRLAADVQVTALLSGNIVLDGLDVDQPQLLLAMKGGKLNLLTALVKEQASSEKPPDLEVRIENIRVTRAQVRFADGKKLSVVADGIEGRGRAEVFVAQKLALVTISQTKISSGTVKLEQLDVPFDNVQLQGRLVGKTLEIKSATGRALKAPFSAGGKITAKGDFPLRVSGHVDVPAGTWPPRLDDPPFPLPKVSTDFNVTGPAEDPDVRLDGSFGAFTADGYKIQSGVFQALVTKAETEITRADVKAGGSTVSVEGNVVHETRRGKLTLGLAGLPLAYAAGGRVHPAPQGTVSGGVVLQGPLDLKQELAVDADLRLRNARAYDTSLPATTSVNARLFVTSSQVRVTAGHLAGAGLEAEAVGAIATKAKRLNLEFSAHATKVAQLRSDIPKTVTVGTVDAAGTITGPFDLPQVSADVTVATARASGVPIKDLRTHVEATSRRVVLDNLTALAAEGPLTAAVELSLLGDRDIDGTFALHRARLERITTGQPGKPLPVAGRAHVKGRISGTLAALVVQGTAEADDVATQGETIGHVVAAYTFSDPNVLVQDLKVHGPLLDAKSPLLVFKLDDETMQGRLTLSRIDVAQVQAVADYHATGAGAGLVALRGTFDRPEVFADVDLKDLVVEGTDLGRGPVHVRVAPARDGDDELLVQASLRLSGGTGRVRARAAYAVDRAVINAEAHVRGVDVGPWVAKASDQAPVVDGEFDVDVLVRGAVKSPDLYVHGEAPAITVVPTRPDAVVGDNGRAFSEEVAAYRTYGRVLVDATLEGGQLEAQLCAFPDVLRLSAVSPCLAGERWWAVASGPVSIPDKTFALDVDLSAADDTWSQFVPALAAAELGIDGEVMSNFDVRRDGAGKTHVDGFVNVETMEVSAPGAPRVHLSAPAEVAISENDVRLVHPALFSVGDRDVAVNGHVDFQDQELGVSVQGQVALALLRLLTDEVSSARGTAETQLVVAGPLDRPRYDGCVRPSPGAQIVPRAWGQPVVFDGGALCLETSRDKPGRHVLSAEQFRALTGEGWVFVDGSVDAEHLFDDEDISLAEWNLRAEGEDLSYAVGRQFATTSFELSLTGPRSEPVLAGTARITEGALRDSFELKNFYLEKDTTAPSEPLYQRLRPASLENLTFDVELLVSDLRVRADVSTIRLDSTLRGELTLSDSVRVPQLTGLIEVSEGNVIFPYANFDIEQTEIEFPRRPDGRISPDIFVLARGDLEPPKSGLETELPCTMTVDGNLDRMTLNFEVEDARVNYDRSTILRFIVFGTPLSSGANFQDREAALRAVSTELTAAFTRDLEETVREQFGTQIQFSLFYEAGQVKGGVRYQLGDRIKFEGETGVQANATGNGDPSQPTGTGSNARLRLLLVDHFPSWWVGEEIAFQGEVQSGVGTSGSQASSDLRLSYRVFEF